MKFLTLTLALVFLGLQASAESKACTKCTEIQKLTLEARNLKDLKSAESKETAQKLIIRTNELLGEHNLTSNNQEDIEEFKRLVVLVSEVLVFDPLTSVAEVLHSEMTSKEGTRRQRTYRNALSLISNSCKRNFLKSRVGEYECNSKASTDEDLDQCVRKFHFDYEKCESEKKKSS